MKLVYFEWGDRVKHWMRTLKDDLYEPLGEISWEAFPTMDYLTPEEALQDPFEPVIPGYTWGYIWEYCWFKGSITLPSEAKGQRSVMDLKPEGEFTLFVNGESFGTYRASWVNEPHHFIEDNVLSRRARGGERYDLLMESYAGHFIPEAESEPVRKAIGNTITILIQIPSAAFPGEPVRFNDIHFLIAVFFAVSVEPVHQFMSALCDTRKESVWSVSGRAC